MNRRSFGRLFAGTVTATGISGVSTTESHPRQARRDVASVVPLSGGGDSWELVILDPSPTHLTEVDGTGVADMDGDGRTEVIITGDGAVLWYRPTTSEKGVIARGHFSVGVALEDIDRDGWKEIVTGKEATGKSEEGEQKWALCWYKSGANLHDSWTEHILDGETSGYPHDVVFGDLDGDGQRELVASAIYCDHPGLFVYKVPADPTNPWKKHVVQNGRSAEGTVTGDLDGDGKEEIVFGPY